MFCKICGKENSSSSLYCSNDGVRLDKKETDLLMQKSDKSNCSNCQEMVLDSHLYCWNCGESLYALAEGKENQALNQVADKVGFPKNKENKSQKGEWKMGTERLIKYGLGISLLAFLSSIIMAFLINKGLSNYLSLDFGLDLDLKFVKALDPMAINNAGSIKAMAKTFTGEAFNLKTSGTFFGLIMDSLLVFFIIGGYISWKTEKKELLKEFGIIALIYGVFISLMSLFARGQIELNLPYGMGYEIGSISRSYSMLSLLFRGFIHVFFAMNLGHGLVSFITNFKKRSPNPLEIVSLVVVVSLLFAFIVGGLLIDEDIYYMPNNLMGEIASFIMKVQSALYIMLSMNMGKIVANTDGSNYVFSILDNSEFLSELEVGASYLYLGLLITMVLFFLYGRNIKKEGKESKEIIYTAVLFAFFISIIGYMGSIEIKIDQMDFVYYKSSYFMTFLGSFLISLLTSLSGYLLAGSEEGNQRNV